MRLLQRSFHFLNENTKRSFHSRGFQVDLKKICFFFTIKIRQDICIPEKFIHFIFQQRCKPPFHTIGARPTSWLTEAWPDSPRQLFAAASPTSNQRFLTPAFAFYETVQGTRGSPTGAVFQWKCFITFLYTTLSVFTAGLSSLLTHSGCVSQNFLWMDKSEKCITYPAVKNLHIFHVYCYKRSSSPISR